MRHIFLTGERQIGKSTILNRVVVALALPVCGFYSFFDSGLANGERRLLISPAQAGRSIENAQTVVRFHGGKPAEIDAAAFDRCAAYLHPQTGARLMLMDECGNFESRAAVFQQSVLAALDGKLPVFGVLRFGGGTWRDQIAAHPDVTVYSVTTENRDALPDEILKIFRDEV